MAAQRRSVDDLLHGESSQISNRSSSTELEACVHPVWREKVIRWYFSIVSALNRQQQQAQGGPFNRTSVHVTAGLLDRYLLALPLELALRYKHDRAAYQLLATSCLLIGMRLTQYDQQRSQVPSESEDRSGDDHPTCQLKHTKTYRDHMDQADHQEGDVADKAGEPSRPTAEVPPLAVSTTMAVIPTAATILEMSAAPKTISESKILAMVREVTGSRAFPRSHVITALDYIRALSSSSVPENNVVTLAPDVAEEAYRLADVSLLDATLIGCRPSVVAAASIALAMFRSHHGSDDMLSLRQNVCSTMFGEEPEFQVAVRKVEAKIIAVAHQATRAHAHAPRQMHLNHLVHHSTAHLIPLEEE